MIIETYPTNLITEDRWGALPLLYAFWGTAPSEIIQFLIESYQSLYPDHVFNWTMMVETIGRTDTPKESIENLLCVKQMHFPGQSIDWENLLDTFSSPTLTSSYGDVIFLERMQYLFKCGMSARVEALAFKVWRDCITNMIETAYFRYNEDNHSTLHEIQRKIAQFDNELLRLKEATSILELALWKTRIIENTHKWGTTKFHKKMKTDESSIRMQCRVTCGADIVIGLVLPYCISDLRLDSRRSRRF